MVPPTDLLIVGAGAAGAVLAARLSALGGRTVTLVEAGPDPFPAIPPDIRNGTRNSMTAHDWGFRHRPTPSSSPMSFPRGRLVGGSSAVNTCIALRGQRYDYDEWGLDGWRYDDCFPAFLRMETDLDFPNSEIHGHDGPIPVRRHPANELVPWQQAFLDACQELGFERCDDHNDLRQSGAGPQAMNKIDGERMSAARCYLTAEVRARPNLRIVPHAHAVRVLFEGHRAVGLEVVDPRTKERQKLTARQVILCAGALGTPGILLRSGVGPEETLTYLGVKQVAEAPVGKRLLDHPGAAIFLMPRPGVCQTDDPLIQTTLRYTPAQGLKDEMQLQPASFVPLPACDTELVSIMTSVGKPRAYGSLRFESAAPFAKPIIESDFLVEPEDLEKAAEAMELAWLCASSKSMRDLATFFLPTERAFTNRRAIREWLPRQTGSGYHPCGTVPMGDLRDPEVATDIRGRVRGTDNLFVADASLFPTVPSANTHLPTLMVGERFADFFADELRL